MRAAGRWPRIALGALAAAGLMAGMRAYTLRGVRGREQCYLVELRTATPDGSPIGIVVERKGPSRLGCEIRFPRAGGAYVLVFDYGEGRAPGGKWPRNRPYDAAIDDSPGPLGPPRPGAGFGAPVGEGRVAAGPGAQAWP